VNAVNIDLTWLSYLMLAVVLYYLWLFMQPLFRRARKRGSAPPDEARTPPFVVLVIPAHNEEAVIGRTLDVLCDIDYPDKLILVVNDGSTDRTSEIARTYGGRDPVGVVDRDPSVAGQGKGAVLNYAVSLVRGLVAQGSPLLRGRDSDHILIGVMDADGQLQLDAIGLVAPYFDDPSVGGVQIGVRIANADASMLTRMQDMEFVGFSSLVQEARDGFGSVGLGGNGQFTRLSALESLGREPWSDCLTEDLDLGLSLAERGWRIRYCPNAFVAQQGLTALGPLLRQRTRWIQGHYQCWGHMSKIVTSRAMRWWTKIDLMVYLTMITFVIFVSGGLAANLLGMAGIIAVTSSFLSELPEGVAKNALHLTLSFGPLLMFAAVYQRRSAVPLRIWEFPTFVVAFSLYAYLFVISQVWAWTRMLLRRGSWAKTPRLHVGQG
jgi:1,2-diacylglycerol 3-beta-glucosyltransferase